MSPYAKFGLDRPSCLAGHWQQTLDKRRERHIAFYDVDNSCGIVCYSLENMVRERSENRYFDHLTLI